MSQNNQQESSPESVVDRLKRKLDEALDADERILGQIAELETRRLPYIGVIRDCEKMLGISPINTKSKVSTFKKPVPGIETSATGYSPRSPRAGQAEMARRLAIAVDALRDGPRTIAQINDYMEARIGKDSTPNYGQIASMIQQRQKIFVTVGRGTYTLNPKFVEMSTVQSRL